MNIQRKNSAHHFRLQSEREQTFSIAQSRWPPVCHLATVVFPRVCTMVFP